MNQALAKYQRLFPATGGTRLDRALAAIRAGRVSIQDEEVHIIAATTTDENKQPVTWKMGPDGKCKCPDAQKEPDKNPYQVCYHMVAAELARDPEPLSGQQITLYWEKDGGKGQKTVPDSVAGWCYIRRKEADGRAAGYRVWWEIDTAPQKPVTLRGQSPVVKGVLVRWTEADQPKEAAVDTRQAAGEFIQALKSAGVPWRSITATPIK